MIIELENIVKNYGGKVITPVLHDISLAIAERDFLAVTGQSGSGKTTLLNIMGLLDRPTAGKITVEGRDIATIDDGELTALRGRTVGFVFQFHHLINAFTVLENVMLPMLAEKRLPKKEIQERAEHILQKVGMTDRMRYKPDEISGGQRQRAAIARALAMKPKVILADEPTGNLDSKTSREVFELLYHINETDAAAFVIVTHDPNIAAQCRRKVSIVDGRLIS